jgi:hypothetical protein
VAHSHPIVEASWKQVAKSGEHGTEERNGVAGLVEVHSESVSVAKWTTKAIWISAEEALYENGSANIHCTNPLRPTQISEKKSDKNTDQGCSKGKSQGKKCWVKSHHFL